MVVKKKSETTNPRTHVLGTEVYTTEQVAADLQLSQKTVLRAIKSGKLRARKSGRQFLMTKEDVRAFFESLPLATGEGIRED